MSSFLKCSSTMFVSTQGKFSLLQTFPLVSEMWCSRKLTSPVKLNLKKALCPFITCSFATFLLIFLLLLMYLQISFLMHFIFLSRFSSRQTFTFLTLSLQTGTVSLCSFRVTCLCFHTLTLPFLYLSYVRSNMFIHAGVMQLLLTCASSRTFLNLSLENQLSHMPLLSRIVLHCIFPKYIAEEAEICSPDTQGGDPAFCF